MEKKRFGYRLVALVLIVSILAMTTGCAGLGNPQGGISPEAQNASMGGGLIGAVAGALLDKKNRWRGGAIGAVAGALLAGASAEYGARSARERSAAERAAYGQVPVVVQDQSGRLVQYLPAGDDLGKTKCTKVVRRTWDKGQMVEEKTEEVCRGERVEARY